MIKFYRVACFKQIGGFVRELMWDGIDGHRCRMLGWIAASWNDPQLRFEHLRPMGTSDRSWWRGRVRHGVRPILHGHRPAYLVASALYRMTHPPLVLGGIAMLWGYFKSAIPARPRYDDLEFRRFLHQFQRQKSPAQKSPRHRDARRARTAQCGTHTAARKRTPKTQSLLIESI